MATLASVIQRGTRASQPAATAVSIGTLYSVTDEGDKVERSNGATWDQYAPSAGGTVTNTGTLTSGKTIVGNGSADVTVSALTAQFVGSSSGTAAAASMTTNRLLGRTTASSGAVEEITPSASLTFATTALGVNAAGATVLTDETTTSGSFGDLSTAGPSVTLTTGTSVLVWLTANTYSTATGSPAYISVAVSGSTTLAASDDNAAVFSIAVSNGSTQMARCVVLTGLTQGSNTFKMQYKRGTSGTFHFLNRTIAVLAL